MTAAAAAVAAAAAAAAVPTNVTASSGNISLQSAITSVRSPTAAAVLPTLAPVIREDPRVAANDTALITLTSRVHFLETQVQQLQLLVCWFSWVHARTNMIFV
jgi:hypothetical protein